jgi:hypothetical protein
VFSYERGTPVNPKSYRVHPELGASMMHGMILSASILSASTLHVLRSSSTPKPEPKTLSPKPYTACRTPVYSGWFPQTPKPKPDTISSNPETRIFKFES